MKFSVHMRPTSVHNVNGTMATSVHHFCPFCLLPLHPLLRLCTLYHSAIEIIFVFVFCICIACAGREAYAECFKIRKCGCYRFRKA